MEDQTQKRLQDQLEALIDDAAASGVAPDELRQWFASETEYQIKTREENGEFEDLG